MSRLLIPLACAFMLLFPAARQVNPQPAALRPELIGLLDFESEHTGGAPKGWAGGPPNTFAVDDKIVHGGRWSLRIERQADSAAAFTAVSKRIPVDFAGAKLELRGFLRTEGVSGFAGLWMRVDGDSGSLAFDNMQ